MKRHTIKDRNGMELTEAEDIKKRWQEYTELYKKDLHDPDKHDGMVTDVEPDILECKVKWALGTITMNKSSGGDGIPAELFQILKDDAMKVLRKAFLSPLTILWNSAFRWVYLSFSPLPFASLLFIAICKASSDNHFAFLHFLFLGMVLITTSCTMF